jgi:Rrf2 family protein
VVLWYGPRVRASQQLKYAIYGVFDLAYHGQDRPVTLQEVGARQLIPARYLEQIFQKLRRAGLVRSKRGPGGGYVLARPPQEISLADVVTAVQGRVLCSAEEAGPARETAWLWASVEQVLVDSLGAHTIGDVCREAAQRGLERSGSEPAMYEI